MEKPPKALYNIERGIFKFFVQRICVFPEMEKYLKKKTKRNKKSFT